MRKTIDSTEAVPRIDRLRQSGISYENMKAPSRLALKMFVSALKNKKNATEKSKKMVEMISSTYDISDVKYIEPIVSYLEEA